jgi:predicted ATPase
MKIEKVTIQNFKSIRSLEEFELGDINVLIGSNGVGKSNFISFLKLLKEIISKNLQEYTASQGGANNLLYFGRKNSEFLLGKVLLNNKNSYQIRLKPNDEDLLYFSKEAAVFFSDEHKDSIIALASGGRESKLEEEYVKQKNKSEKSTFLHFLKETLSDFEVYHFHDTSRNAPIKQTCEINDNRFLRWDASNLAAFLYYLKERKPITLKKIEGTIRQIAPFFDSFILEPSRLNPEKIRLEWKEKGSDAYFNANHLSDGTVRMIALTTLLLQPEPPETIIIDEPELGLHPAAIQLLAGLIRKVSKKSQVIISTQSVTLVNQFRPEDLIIVERENKETVFKRLQEEEIAAWLEDYSLGEAWEKNILGARP